MTSASHAEGPEFDSRSSYCITITALLVQWLEFAVANGEARVRFSDSAYSSAHSVCIVNLNSFQTARLAQLAARRSHNPKVVGSIPTLCRQV